MVVGKAENAKPKAIDQDDTAAAACRDPRPTIHVSSRSGEWKRLGDPWSR